ncbi:glycine betaine/carnitine/choline ABC transporter, permease protein [Gracilibacillus halophilus YIM-C55.5]|uniref:Glycine betaine/carnitine/choline ABC transporter, permease protein n=1 Tax=Gracilibacillus halophilus YIM-C55.5 TaxID=1308866 RepID=N4W6I2_9BACI|nr:ABC transporter permease [Gracilibacillus halophilus]ENH95828.1 glycine betaine/carnitine/choline ABC transporter, permease protein [Gracilibacillus halophilus YIM-C55.5]
MDILTDYFEYWQEDYVSILEYTGEHLLISFVVMLISIMVTVPLAVYMTKMKQEKIKSVIFNIANVFQTIPTVALLAIMIPLFGIGFTPSVVALFLYALLPLLRNTYTGIQSIDSSIVEAAKGMGFSTMQRLFKIELPAALPYVMSGIRVTTVYIISWTTLAALIGGGGLGDLVLAGIGYNDQQMIFTGTFLAIVIALLLDLLFDRFEKKYS